MHQFDGVKTYQHWPRLTLGLGNKIILLTQRINIYMRMKWMWYWTNLELLLSSNMCNMEIWQHQKIPTVLYKTIKAASIGGIVYDEHIYKRTKQKVNDHDTKRYRTKKWLHLKMTTKWCILIVFCPWLIY